MVYLSFTYYLFLIPVIAIYYFLPLRFRWIALLIGSLAFYCIFLKVGFIILVVLSAISYLIGRNLPENSNKRLLYVLGVIAALIPFVLLKEIGINGLAVPVGISYFTLQNIAYLTDIYRERIKPEQNFPKYLLFVCFFPQLLQGPIPRFGELRESLLNGNTFDDINITKGLHLIIWGFF